MSLGSVNTGALGICYQASLRKSWGKGRTGHLDGCAHRRVWRQFLQQRQAGTWDPFLQCCRACTWTHLFLGNKIQRNSKIWTKNNCMYVGTNSGQEDMKRPKNLNLHFEEPGTKAVIALNITKGGRHPEMLSQVDLRKPHYKQS